jgi:DNA-binding LacI/PurR family transcriptional regulator
MKRPTISDIAQRAGVTKAAVSFALNGRPGVSPATRERILAIAAEVGFQPSSAARALTAGQAGAFGLVLGRAAREPGREQGWLELVSGLESELARHQHTLLLTLAEDAAAETGRYRQWWAQRRVDGIFLIDPQVDDQRLAVLAELRLPAVVIGAFPEDPLLPGAAPLPSVGPDDRAAVQLVAGYLAEQGHRRVAQVTGSPAAWRSAQRRDAFAAAAAAAGLTVLSATADPAPEPGAPSYGATSFGATGHGSSGYGSSGYGSPGHGSSGHGAAAAAARVTAGLLGAAEPPTAILYDGDVLAAAGLGAAQRLGISVPGTVSLISWDDSALCELVYPALTALRWDVAAAGSAAARALRALAAGGRPESVPLQRPRLQVRASSGPAGVTGAQSSRRPRRTA